MNKEFFDALEALEKEKGIPVDYMIEKITAALTSAYKKEYGNNAKVDILIDREKKDVKVFQIKDVVEEVELVPFDEENAWDGSYGESVGSYEIRYFTAEDGRNDTASSVSICGTRLVEGRTVIADPEVFKEGTQLIIDGHIFTVSALGHTVEPGVIWVYVDDQASLAYIGRHTEEVYRAVA